MKGLDLSRAYYNEIIKPLMQDNLPQIGNNYAAALIGWGSDVLENDDKLSRDHEWGPRCLIFLPDYLEKYIGITYDMLNSKIPSVFMGYSTKFIVSNEMYVRVLSNSSSGFVNIDITTCEKYFKENLGIIIPNSDIEWLSIPENKLLELTGGEIFFDGTGELKELREHYRKYYPLDVWKYRIAYAWQSLGWDIDLIGLCDARGDFLSARNCLSTSLFRIMKLTFLLNRRYSPAYHKWLGKEFYKLPCLTNKIGPIMESCYLDADIKTVIRKLEKVFTALIKYQNTFETLPEAVLKTSAFSRGFWNIDFQHIANQIYDSIEGELKAIPLNGAVDQWITNDDFFLEVSRIKSLSGIYK